MGLMSLFFIVLFLLGEMSGSVADTIQATTGENSPAILGDNNKIIINGIDARALKRLNDQLDDRDLTIAKN